MKYPGRVIKVGETDATVVKALKNALNDALALHGAQAIELDPDNPLFGLRMKQAVQLFQTRNLDAQGQPLKADGAVGAITWAALFGQAQVPSAEAATDTFLAQVLQVAAQEEHKGVREIPKNSNRGPEVDAYLERAGVSSGLSWCCAFVYWCFDQAALAQGRANPMFKTAGCLAHWNNAVKRGARRIPAADAVANPSLVQPGMVFIMDFGGGLGHTGFVERVEGGHIVTIEGNTDASMTREGGGVYRLTRKLLSGNKGFIDYAGL
ncbi:CHAP domain-containing protein [Polaromonas sp. OV174]|uniref:CHAP domain-containing protein n=1 Tax=Polaromonas sp. OV174 TaxID=1855300 RepID=UPI0008EC6E04|nr:CHAP domain-containing protein [Polaromonas sp. OV174]SFB75937.1 CHAP domain-containing protein [Polaromonas sp. OV174]